MHGLRLITLALSAGLATGAAASPHAGLPDFPVEARPGECWARQPVGPEAAHHPERPGGQSVWTLHRGTGPGAVWSYSERAGPTTPPHDAVLGWSRVDCGSGRPLAMLSPGPVLEPHYGVHAPQFRPGPLHPPLFPPAPPPPPPHHAPGPLDEGPYADPRPAPGFEGPLPSPAPFAFAPPPARPFPAPQFGARFLHWPGKTLR